MSNVAGSPPDEVHVTVMALLGSTTDPAEGEVKVRPETAVRRAPRVVMNVVRMVSVKGMDAGCEM